MPNVDLDELLFLQNQIRATAASLATAEAQEAKAAAALDRTQGVAEGTLRRADKARDDYVAALTEYEKPLAEIRATGDVRRLRPLNLCAPPPPSSSPSSASAPPSPPSRSNPAAKAAAKTVDRYAIRPDEKVSWHDVRETDLEGRAFPDAERKNGFDRLPAEADGKVTPAVWGLSRDSAGLMFRFRTDATTIYAHYKVTKSQLAQPHMPATGVSGLDLYARDQQGRWRWVQVARPTAQEMKIRLADGLDAGRTRIRIYLPLYNGVEFLHRRRARRQEVRRASSRAEARGLLRHLHHPRRAAPAVRAWCTPRSSAAASTRRSSTSASPATAAWTRPSAISCVRIDAAAYVIDCLPNMSGKEVAQKCAAPREAAPRHAA
jgi:hypothetical protein